MTNTYSNQTIGTKIDSKIESYQKWLPSAKIATRFALAYSTCGLSEILVRLPKLGVKIVLGAVILGGSFAGTTGIIKSQRESAIYNSPENVAIRENYARISTYVTSGKEFTNELGQTCQFFNERRESLLCGEKLTASNEEFAKTQSEASARDQSRRLNATMGALNKNGCFYNEETGKWDGAWN